MIRNRCNLIRHPDKGTRREKDTHTKNGIEFGKAQAESQEAYKKSDFDLCQIDQRLEESTL